MAILNTVAQFGRYVLRSRMADAGACEVWIAEIDGPTQGSGPVIFKKLRSEFAQDASFLESFTQRGRRASQLNHDCIARVLDVVINHDECGLAIEFVDGKSLRQLIRAVGGAGNALPVWFAIHVARCICQALEHAHEGRDEEGQPRCILHENLCPENVFLTFLGQVKVTDFGLSRVTLLANGESIPHTMTRSPPCPKPISPTPSVRNDLDGVGRVLYELLTGICPVIAEDPDSPFVPSSHYAPWVSAEVDQLLSRILSPRDPKPLRTAGDVRRALDEYLCARRHDVTATHIAGLVSLLFSAECSDSAPPTMRLQENAVELAMLRSRRTSPPDFSSFEVPTRDGLTRPGVSVVPNSLVTRETVPAPAMTAPPQEHRRDSASQPQSPAVALSEDRARPAEQQVDDADPSDTRATPFRHDWDRALKRVREEVEANQRASGAYLTAAAVARAETPTNDPLDRAVAEFERGLEHMRRGEFESALKAWERTLEFDPQHRVCRANLNLLKKKLGAPP